MTTAAFPVPTSTYLCGLPTSQVRGPSEIGETHIFCSVFVRENGSNQTREDKSCNKKGGPLTASRRINVNAGRRTDSDIDVGLVLWLQAKQILRERRAKEAKARAKRQRREQ